MITRANYGELTVAQSDDCDYEESGWIALVDGDDAYLAQYGHCSCYGTWTALCGHTWRDDCSDDFLPANWYVWQGTKQEMIELARCKADPAVPNREAQPDDCDYDHLMEVYKQLLKDETPEAVAVPELSKKEYVLTIKCKIGAIDDVEARNEAMGFLDDYGVIPGEDTKLQEVFKDKTPRKVEL